MSNLRDKDPFDNFGRTFGVVGVIAVLLNLAFWIGLIWFVFFLLDRYNII